MIIVLSVLISIAIILLCVFTAIYKHRFKEAINSTYDDIVVLTFEQFMPLYRIAPEKYTLEKDRYYRPLVCYNTKVGRKVYAGTLGEVTVYDHKSYTLYFENPMDYLSACSLIKHRDKCKQDAEVQQNSIKKQKEFIELVRKDLNAFEKEGEANGDT